jgi:hypothetical protein
MGNATDTNRANPEQEQEQEQEMGWVAGNLQPTALASCRCALALLLLCLV